MKEETFPDEAAWLAARTKGLGGSDAAAILGLSPFQTPLGVFADKLGLTEPTLETPAMRFGKLLEPLIADEYVRETHRTLRDPGRFTLARSEELPYLFATLDREIVVADGKAVPAVLEIKSTSAYRADDWIAEPPPHVLIQGQHQLLVTGRAWISFAVLIGGSEFRWVDSERNEAFIAVLRDRLAEFWRRLELNDPPPAGAEDKAVLAVLYPAERLGTRIRLPLEAETWDADRETAAAEVKKYMKMKDEAEAKIKAALGDHAEGVLPHGGKYSWKTQARAEHLVPAASFRVLRRHER